MASSEEYFGDVESFLRNNTNIGSSLRPKLLVFFDDLQKKAFLQLELAAVVDCGKQFVEACHMLEGDGPLALTAHELISTLSSAILVDHFPHVEALSRSLSAGNASTYEQ